jgi:hypothetical protein
MVGRRRSAAWPDAALTPIASPRPAVNLTPIETIALISGIAAALFALRFIDQSLPERSRAGYRYIATAGAIAAFFFAMHRYVADQARAVDITKALIAVGAAACVFYEAWRAGMQRPVAERWKRFVGISLGIAAIVAYFNGFNFAYAKYYHRWDQYHYYMGAKYFRELGYDGLYKCGVVAEDELGVQHWDENGRTFTLDMSKEVRHPDKKIRNLGGDNLLMPVTDIVDHHEICTAHFAPERWNAFKEDVKFFRIASDKTYWEDMQKDHGYNPPPGWTVMGRFFAELHPATVGYLQFLASLDLVYLAGMFAALWWGFGWRVFAVGAIFWGCQASAPFYWTGGAFLRQDWLFFLALSAAAIRKKHFKTAGAALVYAGLLRIFPGLVIFGWLAVAAFTWLKHRRMPKHHQKVLLGGVLAAALIIPVSLGVAGKDSYTQFFKHTIQVHDHTPLTNHMGLRVLVGHNMNPLTWNSYASGRMKFTKDTKLQDPFQVWKDLRETRYAKYKPIAYAITALSLAAFAWLVKSLVDRKRRAEALAESDGSDVSSARAESEDEFEGEDTLWIAQCIGQIFIILMSQLTCYYYSFMVLAAPLTKLKPEIEAPLFGLAALTQFVAIAGYWNDDRYTGLTAISLAFCYGIFWIFWPRAPKATEPSENAHANV